MPYNTIRVPECPAPATHPVTCATHPVTCAVTRAVTCAVTRAGQIWCGQHAGDGLCGDGGPAWAIPPVGTAATAADAQWAPKADAVLAAPGAAADAAAAGQRAGAGYGCACLKNCQCTAAACWCASERDRAVVGSDPAGSLRQLAAAAAISPSKAKTCACTCGGVLGA